MRFNCDKLKHLGGVNKVDYFAAQFSYYPEMNLIITATMFRIKKVFENPKLAIYKIEGKITDESLQVWIDELHALNQLPDRKIILDFCQAWSLSASAIEFLTAYLSNSRPDIQIMNTGIDVRNTLHAAGLSARVLE